MGIETSTSALSRQPPGRASLLDESQQMDRVRRLAWIAVPLYFGFALSGKLIYDTDYMTAVAATAGCVCLLIPLAIRLGASAVLGGNLFTAALYIQTAGEMLFAGSVDAPAANLSLLVVPAAMFCAGPRSAYCWTSIVVIGLIAIYYLDRGGVLPPPELARPERVADTIQSMITAICAGLVLVHLYHRQTSTALAQAAVERERFEHLANHDSLTGLPNRKLFMETLKREAEAADATGRRFALFFIDLNQFKDINDRLGHAAGDRVLQAVAQRLRAVAREDQLFARLAGDEFVALCRRIDSHISAAACAAQLRKQLGEPFDLDGSTVQVTPSIGFALYGLEADSPDALLKLADAGMYQDKAVLKAQGVMGLSSRS